jgi:hypothetical protein
MYKNIGDELRDAVQECDATVMTRDIWLAPKNKNKHIILKQKFKHMKKVVVSLSLLLLVSATSFAQSEKYTNGMQANLTLLDSAKTPEAYNAVSAAFERIGDAEKTQWLPYYYAALATVRKGFTDQKADKDAIANEAEKFITKAEALEPKNAEIFIIKNMIATLHMLVDPPARWMQYGGEASKALAAAKQIDPNNPRVYFLEGQSVFGTPVQFGGGKDKAKPLFEKSVQLFDTYKPVSELHPKWGKGPAAAMLAKCS